MFFTAVSLCGFNRHGYSILKMDLEELLANGNPIKKKSSSVIGNGKHFLCLDDPILKK